MAVASANGYLQDSQRETLDAEFSQSRSGIDRLIVATRYNNDALLAGQIAVDETSSTAVSDEVDTGVTKVELSGVQQGTYTFEDLNQDSTLTLGNGVVSQTVDL